MHSQIFKTIPPISLLYSFLNNAGYIDNNYYLFSKTEYKSATMKDLIEPFMKNIRQYYYHSKLFYINKSHTYKSVATILRQICKVHKIPFNSYIKYSKSAYIITYKILII